MSSELVEVNAGAPQLIQQQMLWAKAAANSDIIPAEYRGKPANILIAVGFGSSMGLSLAESLYRINVIKGKPTMSAELIAAQVRRQGHKLRVVKDEQQLSVTASITRADDPEFTFSATRDKAWAQRMGLASKDNYVKQPITMLTWRAISAVAREACPEALFGAGYTPDEMHDMDASQPRSMTQTVERESAPAVHENTASQWQADLHHVMAEAGVESAQEAAGVLSAILNRPISTISDVTARDAALIMANPKLVTAELQKLREHGGN